MNPKHLKYVEIARAVAELSKDRSTKVGSIAIGPANEIRAMGYNGFPRGVNDDVESRHERPAKHAYTEHAERNLIYNAARVGASLDGCALVVVPLFCCVDCARAVIQSGFKEVIAPRPRASSSWYESNMKALEMFNEVGLTVHFLEDYE